MDVFQALGPGLFGVGIRGGDEVGVEQGQPLCSLSDAAGGRSCCQIKPCSLLLAVWRSQPHARVCVRARMCETGKGRDRKREYENMNGKAFLCRVQGTLEKVPWRHRF